MKYIEIGLTYWKAQIVWRFDVMMSVAFTSSRILLAYILWGAIYAGRELVAGMDFGQMLTYYIVCAFLRELDMSSGTCAEFAHRIRQGLFSAYMVRPVSVQGHFFAQSAGVSAYYGMFQLAAVALWVFLFRVRFAVHATPAQLAGAFAMAAVGLLFMAAFNFAISVLAFRFHDISAFNMVKDGIINLTTGVFIPLSLLPAGVVAAMRYLPFYYVAYLPASVVLGVGTEEIGRGLTTLALWTIALIILGRYLYARYRIRYDGVGI